MPYDAFFRDTQQAIRAGADLNHQGKDGIALLHYWVNVGRADIVELLLQNGPDVNIRDDSGWTPLHFAAAQGHVEIVKLLVEHGADTRALARGKSAQVTPLSVAKNAGHQTIAEYLAQSPD